MMKLKFFFILLILPLLSRSSSAQVVYKMKDCIATGLEKNFSLLVVRNSETIANNNFTIGNAGFLPTLDLTGRYSGTNNNTTQNLTDGTQNISKGVNNTISNGGISLGWTIFNGFNVQTTYKKLNQLKQVGELNTQLEVENLIADIISSYYLYIQQRQTLKNLQYAVALSKERLIIDEERYLVGTNSKLQVLQSKVYFNADSSNYAKQFEVARAAQIRLNELMAVEDIGTSFVTQDTSVDVNPLLLYEKLLEETLTNNTTLTIASKNKILSEYDYKLVVSRSYPYLNFSTGYNYSFNTYSTGNSKNQITNGMNYGLTLGLPLFDGFNQRRSINNSSIEVKNKELKYLEIEQGVRADLLKLFYAYNNNLKLINLEEQNLQTATENLDIALEKYRLGNLSGLDLRDVQKSLLDAKQRLLSIQFQTKLAEISLQLISGNVMTYYK